jgi:ribonuclease HI
MGIGGHLTIDGVEVVDFSERAGKGTNNQAEYLALIHGAKLALQLNVTHLDINMDSLLIVNQMTGTWRNKDAELTRLMGVARKVVANFEKVTYAQIPREQNKKADNLATLGRSGTGTDNRPAKKTASYQGEDTKDILLRIERKLDLLLDKLDSDAN